MAVIIHKNIIEGELHPPKGFNLPATNPMSYALRSESDVAIYQDVEYLPGALNFVDGNNPPPTTAVDDIYVIFDGGGGVVDAAWGGISFDSWTRQDGSNWNEVAPVDGYQCYDKTAKEYKTFNGTAWTSGGGADTNIGTNNLTLSGAATRTYNIDGNELKFIDGANNKLKVMPSGVGIGNVGTPVAQLEVKGSGITSGTTALLVQNSVGTDLFEVKDDGQLIGAFPIQRELYCER